MTMTTCRTVTKEVLPNPVAIHLQEGDLDFSSARLIADAKVREMTSDPMLLAWYDRKQGAYSPNVECCSEHKPGWIVYAESRGGNISIDINDETYVFIYADLAGKYAIRYWIVSNDQSSAFREVFRTQDYKVLEISASDG